MNFNLNKPIYEQIKERSDRLGISVYRLSKIAGLEHRYLYGIKNQRPNPRHEKLKKIDDALRKLEGG